jgi:Acetyltransferase (GNAT) domain
MLELRAERTAIQEGRRTGPALRAEVTAGVEPREWDGWVRTLGGGPFHCAAWARYRASAPHKQPLFFMWRQHGASEPVAVALGIDASLPGPVRARAIEFDAPPATRVLAHRLVPTLEGWMRSEPGVAEAWLGSFDAEHGWSDVVEPPTRIEFRVDPATPDELLARMRTLARRSLRRAERHGIEIDSDSAALGAFVELYSGTLVRLQRTKRVSTMLADANDLARRLGELRSMGTARLFLACSDGVPVAAALFTVFGARAFYLSGGTNELGRRTGAMTAVLYRAMCEFSAAGLASINLGGASADSHLASSSDHGLYQFKRGMGANPRSCRDASITARPVRRQLVHAARAARLTLVRLKRSV